MENLEQMRRVRRIAGLPPVLARAVGSRRGAVLARRAAGRDGCRRIGSGVRVGCHWAGAGRTLWHCPELVIELLHERGVEVRHPRVNAEDTALAVEWYRQGMRQTDISERLGRHKGVVWHLLRRAGVW